MENSTELKKSSTTSSAVDSSDSSKSNNTMQAPVEKRKNAGSNTGRRKLTPHPLSPNTNTLDSTDAQQVKYIGRFPLLFYFPPRDQRENATYFPREMVKKCS